MSIVEAAYLVDGSALEWAARILGAATRSLGAGRGGFTCEFRVNDDGTLAIDRGSAAVLGQKAEMVSAIFESLSQAPPGFLAWRLPTQSTAARCLLTSEVDPGLTLPHRKRLARQGVNDEINIFCLDLDRSGFLLSLGIRDRRTMTPGVRRDLGRVATHILAARGLRKRLRVADADAGRGPAPEPVSSADAAWLRSDGDAPLAEARRALQTAVLNVERARTPVQKDAPHAVGEWKGLASTRWTLVDEVDADGAKYIVARQPTVSASLSILTPTERRVVADAARGFSTKEISYSLGIAEATVRVLIMRAARRCGVRTRNELLMLAKATSVETETSQPANSVASEIDRVRGVYVPA